MLLGMLFRFEVAGRDIGELYGRENRRYATNLFELERIWTLRVQERPNGSSCPTEVTKLSTERYAHVGEASIKAWL